MSNQSHTGESFGSNLLMGFVIAASAFMLYAAVGLSQTGAATQAPAHAPAKPAVQQVVVTAPSHVS
jgi:hypothetical protein